MTTSEFIEEVHRSKICPEYLDEDYQRFQEYQRETLCTLKEVHRLCEKNGVRYQLAYGSLLGAVRDKGQISWDYDADIFIPYEDKTKMIQALKTDLSANYYVWCPEIDTRCDHTLMRITPMGYHSNAIHVDVFYMMALPSDPKERQALTTDISKLYHTRSVKMTNPIRDSHGSIRRILYLFREKLEYLSIRQDYAESEYERRCSLYQLNNTEYCAPACTGGETLCFSTEKLWDTRLLNLSVGQFRITNDTDNPLRKIYGDYMKFPSLEKRIKEMYSSLRNIDYYKLKSNIKNVEEM